MDDAARENDLRNRSADTSPADDRPSTKPAVTSAVGAAAGAAAGATAGTLTAGPIGTIVGAITGAVGGGLAGLATGESIGPSEEDEAYYREHYATTGVGAADTAYERVRPAYHLGHIAALNPDYRGRAFTEIEPDLRRGWTDEVRARHGDWTEARRYAQASYERTLDRTNAGPAPRPPGDVTPRTP